MAKQKNTVRIAAVGDIHIEQYAQQSHLPLFQEASLEADVLLLCGDLTHHGIVEEAQELVNQLSVCTIPVLAVMGNHDYTSDQAVPIIELLRENGVHVLLGEALEIEGVGFAGTKGFGGGFGTNMLSPFGEEVTKQYVQEGVNEAVALENALSKIRDVEKKVVLLHYAPIQTTVEGEPPEIYNHLGCSRLEDPLNRYSVQAVFHGHAHRGKPEGKTTTGISVYNVAFPLLQNQSIGLHYKLIEV